MLINMLHHTKKSMNRYKQQEAELLRYLPMDRIGFL